MSTIVEFGLNMTIKETIDLGISGVTNPVVDLGWNTTGKLTSASAGQEVTKDFSSLLTLVAGVKTIDLTAAPWFTPNGGSPLTQDLTALRFRVFKLRAPVTNTAGVVIKGGATNPYLLFGTAGQITLLPGAEQALLGGVSANALPAIGSTSKNIDLSSTQATAQLEIIVAVG